MKKIKPNKLTLAVETIRTLGPRELAVAGGLEIVVGPIVPSTRSIIISGCKFPIVMPHESLACGGGGGGGG